MRKKTNKKKKVIEQTFLDKIKKSLSLINSNKKLFSIQIAITLFCLLVLTLVLYKFSLDAIGHQQAVFAYIESIDETVLDQPLGDDPLVIYQHIKGARTALILMFLFSAITIFIFEGLAFLSIKLMISKKDILEFIKGFTAVFLSYSIPFTVFFYITFKLAFKAAVEEIALPAGANILSWLILVLLMYLLYISLALTTNSKLKEIPKKTLLNALKLHIAVPIYALALSLIIGFALLIQMFLEGNMIILTLSVFILLISISYSRTLIALSFE